MSESAAEKRESVTVYTPESSLKKPVQLLREMVADIGAGRELAFRMFMRNLKGMYRQTLLGIFWAFLPPLAHTALWVFLNSSRVVPFGDELGAKYPIYVLCGMVLWQSFIEAFQKPLNIVQGSQHMLSKLRFPRESILVVGFYDCLFNLAIRTAVLIPLLFFFAVPIHPGMLLAIPAALFLILLGFGLGSLIMPFGVLYHDVGRFIAVITPVWMIFTQIVYPPPDNWATSPLNWANPASPLLLFSRDLLVMGQTEHVLTASIYAVATIPLCLLGLIVYRLSVPILVERVSN